MKTLILLIMFCIFSGLAAEGMADSSRSKMSAGATTCKSIGDQKFLEWINQQEKNAADWQKMKLQAQEDDKQSQEKYLKRVERSEADQARAEKILSTQEVQQARFDKILSTWEHQQQQYQQYLDRLKH
jgi:hypothetical protein